jgi:hypothetical protein
VAKAAIAISSNFFIDFFLSVKIDAIVRVDAESLTLNHLFSHFKTSTLS